MAPRSPATATLLVVAAAAAACGGAGKSAVAGSKSWKDEDVARDRGAEAPAAAGGDAPATPERATVTLVAGHVDARYELDVPPGLARLRGVTMQPGEDPHELSAAGPDGVGLPGSGTVSYDSIVVFSDPLGLGVDLASLAPEARDRLVALYGEGIRERVPSATDARLVVIGRRPAIRIDLPRVAMPDRPVRSGRHYLVVDGVVTVAVDCLWTEPNAARMSQACDAVAASLRRHTRAR